MFLNRCSYWSAAIHNPTSFIKIDVRLTDTSLSRKLISFSLDKKTRWMYDVTIVRNSTEWILIIIAKWEPTLIYWYSLLIDRVICIYFMLLHVHSVSVFLFQWKDEKEEGRGDKLFFLFSEKWIVSIMRYAWCSTIVEIVSRPPLMKGKIKRDNL